MNTKKKTPPKGKAKKRTAEELNALANRALHQAWREVSYLRHAASAAWPPSELRQLPKEIQGRVNVAPSALAPSRRQQWDFRCGFPSPSGLEVEPFSFLEDAEVLPCHEYEIARENREWIEQVKEWRGERELSFSALLDLWCQRWRNNEKRPSTEFYVLWPEWPDAPYLSLPPVVRQNRLRIWTGRAFKIAPKPKRLVWEPPSLDTVSVSHLFAYREAFWKRLSNYDGPYQDAIIDETITFSGEKHELWRTREFVAFDLNWDDSNESMVERFRVWVEKRRKERGIRERELRGSSSFTKQMRTQLCALGAWRLIHKAGMEVRSSRSETEKGMSKDVHAYTERISGRALYKDPLTWKRNLERITGPLGIPVR